MKFTLVFEEGEPSLGLAVNGNGKIVSSAFSFYDPSLAFERVWEGVDLARRRGLVLNYSENELLLEIGGSLLLKVKRSLSNELVRLSLVDKLELGFLTDFEKKVYLATLSIPFGETSTYGELAREIGTSPRAVGQALARNPFSPIIPCHRIVGKSGPGGFYGSSNSRDKERMIALERKVKEESEKWAGWDLNP